MVGLMSETEDIKEALNRRTPGVPPVPTKDLLSTGSTLLNLACSGRPQGGLAKGKYFFFVGDSSSGKTFLTLTCFAEATQRRAFDDYTLWYNDSEFGALMDFEKFFGPKVAERVEVTHEDMLDKMYMRLIERLKNGERMIFVQDSMDSLNTNEEEKKLKAAMVAEARGKADELKGSYGMEKAKLNSIRLRRIMPLLRETGSIMIVIAQTRDNIDPMSYETKTRAGGKALKFYATLEMWTSIAKKLNKTVRDKQRQVGIITKIAVKKNRLSGKEWAVEVPIYHSYGIDDIGSCIDYLTSEKHWKKAESGGKITAADFNFEGTRDALIKKIETEGLEKDLRMAVAGVWADIEAACALKRKPRYG
jgi:recombination protein RecA